MAGAGRPLRPPLWAAQRLRWIVPALLALLIPAAAHGQGLHVLPFPGTPDAAPHTQIVFSSLKRADLRWIEVIGAQTGAHLGHMTSLPNGAGTAFVPDRAFASGELVRVRAGLSSPSAGTASGAPGARTLAFSFSTAVPAARSRDAVDGNTDGARGQAAASGRAQSFHSQSFAPPTVSVSSDPDTASGDIFLTPLGGPQTGNMILDPSGQLVWFLPAPGSSTFNLAVQQYLGHSVLTFWQGHIEDFHGIGDDVIMDHSYRTLATIHAGNGYSADLHDFQITPQGTALIDAYVPVTADLTSVGGSKEGRVYDCVIQEISISTGQVLWEWHSLGHVPVSASYRGKPSSRIYQYFHLNSIQQLPNGNLLISARNTWAVYEIRKSDGSIVWTLGGKRSTFRVGREAKFEWQHDARLYGSTLTVFDDADNPKEEDQSSVKVLTLHTKSKTASLANKYVHSPALLVHSQGNGQLLPDGDMFVGWGSNSAFSEYSPTGRQILDGNLPLGITSYRAFRFPWTGQPVTPPSLAASAAGQTVHLYASWNGATAVAFWRVKGGTSPSNLTYIATVRKTGFETPITITSSASYFAVKALDANHDVLGTSPTRSR